MLQAKRAGSKQTLSLKVFSWAILGLLVLGLVGCGGTNPTPTPPVEHQTYNYVPDITGAIVDQKWKSGDELKIGWKAQPKEVTSNSRPVQVNLQLALYGPATTKEEAEKLIATGSPLAQAPAVQTDSWNGQPQASTLILPPGLAPGTYHLVTQIEYLDPISGSRSQTSATSAITVGN